MKRTLLFVLLAATLLSCRTQNTALDPVYTGIRWDSIDNIQCGQDQFMRIPSDVRSTALLRDLTDAYNSLVVLHSAFSDQEYCWGWGFRSDSVMLNMDLSVFHSRKPRIWARDLLANLAAAQTDTTISIRSQLDVLGEYIYQVRDRYCISSFFDTEKCTEEKYLEAVAPCQWVPDIKELKALREQDDTTHQDALRVRLAFATDINTRILLANEYARSSSQGAQFTEAIPYLEEVLTAGEYSPLLGGAWRTWRALMTSAVDTRKDADIPNAEFNQMRRVVGTISAAEQYFPFGRQSVANRSDRLESV